MNKNELIGRVAQKAEIPGAEAFEAVAATLQGLIDNLCGTVLTTVTIAPDPGKPFRMFIDVPNPPPSPHVDVPTPSPSPHIDVPNPPPSPHIDVPNPPPSPHVDVPMPPPRPHIVRNPSGLVAYVAGRVGISSSAAAAAIAVILEEIAAVGREAGVKSKA